MSNRLYAFGVSGFFQVLWLLAFGAALIGAILLGAVILSLLLGVAAVGAIAFYLRMWWLKRRLGRRQRGHASGPPRGELIHAEYIVVSERPMPRGRWD